MRAFAILCSFLDLLVGGAFALPHLALFQQRERRWDTPRRRRRGLALILGGIEGPSLAQHAMATGLIRGGWRGAIRIHRWNAGVPCVRCFLNLMSRRRHERTSRVLAQEISEHRGRQPRSPIIILSVSGGCWIAVRALEQLAPQTAIAGLVLLAPAISPRHDLNAALAASRAGILLVRSPFDVVLLTLGTSLFGSSDRRHGAAAGCCGFALQRPDLHERVWRPSDARHGYFGSHCTAIAPRFLAAHVTPWLLAACGDHDAATNGAARDSESLKTSAERHS